MPRVSAAGPVVLILIQTVVTDVVCQLARLPRGRYEVVTVMVPPSFSYCILAVHERCGPQLLHKQKVWSEGAAGCTLDLHARAFKSSGSEEKDDDEVVPLVFLALSQLSPSEKMRHRSAAETCKELRRRLLYSLCAL
ncbi:hypothetical protein HPB50_003547 [Hyalomma asiaticum]|uniref:Uncharacterized protein n=1 Tax=Hyalomma asiaticum TaxID=266040 RepID=A0ACB7SR67_HYAAI|nr:hypothetical protein HPB50_003547 [Hyalomma asiaticum]